MLAGRPFLPDQKHKHETWKLQDYKAACWLFTHLIQLQHIMWGKTETRLLIGDIEQSLTEERGLNSLVFSLDLVKCLGHSADDLLCGETCIRLDWLLLKGKKNNGPFFLILVLHEMMNQYQERPFHFKY